MSAEVTGVTRITKFATRSATRDENPRRNERTKLKTRRVSAPVWTDEDQERLEGTKDHEVTVWKKCSRLLDCNPLWVIPDGDYIDISNNEDDDHRWSQSLCKAFSKATLCPAFYHNPNFLSYAVALAKYYRLRQVVQIGRPREILADRGPASFMLKRMEEEFDEIWQDDENRGIARKMYRSAVRDYTREHPPMHFAFTRFIKEAVAEAPKPRGRQILSEDPHGIIARDFDAVSKAWDKYVDSKVDNRMLLKISEMQERDLLSKAKTRMEILEMMKQVELDRKRQDQSEEADEGEGEDEEDDMEEEEQEFSGYQDIHRQNDQGEDADEEMGNSEALIDQSSLHDPHEAYDQADLVSRDDRSGAPSPVSSNENQASSQYPARKSTRPATRHRGVTKHGGLASCRLETPAPKRSAGPLAREHDQSASATNMGLKLSDRRDFDPEIAKTNYWAAAPPFTQNFPEESGGAYDDSTDEKYAAGEYFD
ncbi:hypothetical protein VTL71DRAFT_14046 [Oculimacula yallundae]|uniref:Uncharacterized protein n=1 Tax=Oculimacula yallundae TaxID=86028 RepID=A0ABR4CMH3_9HELO